MSDFVTVHAAGGLQDATIVASSPGRIRIELACLYRSRRMATQLETALRQRPGVRAAYANPLTGRFLFLFDPMGDGGRLYAELGIAPAAPAEPAHRALQAPPPGKRRGAGAAMAQASPPRPEQPWHA